MTEYANRGKGLERAIRKLFESYQSRGIHCQQNHPEQLFDGKGYGFWDGCINGSGSGNGSGYGYGNGSGNGLGYGDGKGDGAGNGYGDGDGCGDC